MADKSVVRAIVANAMRARRIQRRLELNAISVVYGMGLNVKQTGKAFGVSETTVRSRLVEAGVPRHPPGPRKGSRNKVNPATLAKLRRTRELYERLGNKAEVGRQLGISRELVRQNLKRLEAIEHGSKT